MKLWHRPPPPPPLGAKNIEELLGVTKAADDIIGELGNTISEMTKLIQEATRERPTKHT